MHAGHWGAIHGAEDGVIVIGTAAPDFLSAWAAYDENKERLRTTWNSGSRSKIDALCSLASPSVPRAAACCFQSLGNPSKGNASTYQAITKPEPGADQT